MISGVSLFSPDRDMNESEVHIMFATGMGLKVSEARGTLNVELALPPRYNESLTVRFFNGKSPKAVLQCLVTLRANEGYFLQSN